MKSSGVLGTLLSAALLSSVAAQTCIAASTAVTGYNLPTCENFVTGTIACSVLPTCANGYSGTPTLQDVTCGTEGAELTLGGCTAVTYAWTVDKADNAVGYACVADEGTAAVTNSRQVQCEASNAGGVDATDAACSGAGTKPTASNVCSAIPNTCANAVSAGSAFVCSTHATLKTQKAGTTACATSGTPVTPDTCVAAECCELPACTSSADTAKDGTGDGAFYCINGGTIAGAAGSCTCGSCSTGYSGVNCATAAACTAVDTPMAGCVVPDCTAVDTPYAGCTVLACTAADTPWVGCTPPACTSSAILPWEPCTPKACTAVDTPWVGCTPPACTAVDTPYAGCTPPACTAVDTPYAGCTTPDCTDTDTPYAGCTAVTCAKDTSVTSKACVACATGKVNAAGDDQFGADTTCTTKPAPAAAASGAATAAVSLTALLALVLT